MFVFIMSTKTKTIVLCVKFLRSDQKVAVEAGEEE